MEEDPVEADVAPSDHHNEEEEDDDEEEEEDDIDWETIQLPPRFQHQEHEQEHQADDTEDMDVAPKVYNDVEIVMETPRVVLK